MNNKNLQHLIGRILISAIFIYAIPGKIINFEKTVQLISSKNIPSFFASFLLILAILCLILGSILFISGFKQRLGSFLLIIFIVPTTFIFHFFPFQIKAVLMNAGLAGGLILGLNKVKEKSLKDLFTNQTTKQIEKP
tara:strand:- start:1277 stop:1687 length:411 start_codon:yes stop_codon:yes gene_type:complete